MTCVYEQAGPGPQTHALIIGVGRFPNLKGGNRDLIEELQSVEDVTSPPNNARAIAEWLIEAADRLIPPLGSIELLISATDGSEATFPRGTHSPAARAADTVEPATGDLVEAALQAWLQRAESDPDNLALFYGSSHGMQTQEHILLLEDAGANAADPWRNMLSLNHLHRNLYRKENRRSLLFADCCRDLLEDGLSTLDAFSGRRIGNTNDRQYARAKSEPERCVYILRASPLGSVTKATAGGLGYFTESLLRCLKGGTGERRPVLGWCISPESLRKAVENAGRYGLNLPDADIQPRDEESHWVGEPILRLDGPPKYPVRVREAALGDEGTATLIFENGASGYRQVQQPTFRPRSPLCVWAAPNFMEDYRATGRIDGSNGESAVDLRAIDVPVYICGHDVPLERS